MTRLPTNAGRDGAAPSASPWTWCKCYDPTGKRLTSLDVVPRDGHSLSGVAVIASVWGNEANARLIAAAPELLRHLRIFLATAEGLGIRGGNLSEAAALVAQIGGEA